MASSAAHQTAADARAGAPLPPPPRARVATLVKLGGALITDKSQPETLRADALRATARQIATVWRRAKAAADEAAARSSPPAPPPPPLAIVHGAGSFGHPTARAYGVALGIAPTSPSDPWLLRNHPRLLEGLCLTRLRVSRLHAHVLEALLDEGVPAVGLPPFAAPWGPTDGPGIVRPEHSADACARVAQCLDAGLVPVLYGDCVLDTAQGCAVLGGDALMRELARELRPQRAVFLTDVDGVFDRPPDEPGARLVRMARLGGGQEEDEWVLEGDGGGGGSSVRIGGAREGADDISGGMEAKVAEAAAISREAGAPVVVARGGTDAALAALTRGADAFLGDGGQGLRATVVTAGGGGRRRAAASDGGV